MILIVLPVIGIIVGLIIAKVEERHYFTNALIGCLVCFILSLPVVAIAQKLPGESKFVCTDEYVLDTFDNSSEENNIYVGMHKRCYEKTGNELYMLSYRPKNGIEEHIFVDEAEFINDKAAVAKVGYSRFTNPAHAFLAGPKSKTIFYIPQNGRIYSVVSTEIISD